MLEVQKQWGCGFTMLSTSRVYSIRALAGMAVEVKGDRFVPRPGSGLAGFSEKGVAEDFSTEPPLSLYGTSKRASELLASEYAETFGLPVFVLRCGVLAGAGQFGRVDQGIFSYWIHSYCRRNPLKYIGFGGNGCQVRDCLHARDLLPLITQQIEHPRPGAPRILNVSGGLAQSASLRQLSDWCAQRFGPHRISADPANRPFDVPWLVLDSTQAERVWGWKPQTSLEATWSEIALHAEQNPGWLEATAD
ncbi:MAG TPA: NAD-dependent epimerase/dehydratase family protein, partial [Candidatus Acidoferrum sp.]|nr:NAD-dependent epimerase/dehydratase family protein [Candidatus Acidoferrum sp.]